VHLVGIGGIGMSAIARILLAWGVRVSGSDLRLSDITADLALLGATIHQGHGPENLNGATQVVVSSAIPSDNPEVVAARERGLPVLKRADFIGEMMAGKQGIAVAGTHGKTTTTAMIAHLLIEAGLDPSFIVGGILADLGRNARAGQGPHFVIEADEYDGMFLGLSPDIAVITHLERDHPDCYPTLADMVEAFSAFLDRLPPNGHIVACVDAPNVRDLIGEIEKAPGAQPMIHRYGLGPEATWRALDLDTDETGNMGFRLAVDGKERGSVQLSCPGRHNVKNALAALVVADLLDVPTAAEALSRFGGVKRRFEIKGVAKGVTVIDDYAHHPTEIQATLAAARHRYPDREIWAVFQPHTYSRTRALFAEFARSFADADHVIVLDVYAARAHEEARGARPLAKALTEALSHESKRYCPTVDEATTYILDHINSRDVLITLGAGNGFVVGERVLCER
jgi:UDP-N-acetylmuramate--alanine ligase